MYLLYAFCLQCSHYPYTIHLTTVCSRFKTSNISMSMAPSGELRYKRGDKVVLNCTFYPVQESGQKPNWFFIDYDKNGNVLAEFVDSSVAHQECHYDKTNCIWKNTLTISNFSEELAGTYSCGYSYHIINQTLQLLKHGMPLHTHMHM